MYSQGYTSTIAMNSGMTNIRENQLSSKIWCLVEIALHNTYSKHCGSNKHLNPKNFQDPEKSMMFEERQLILENIDLINEIVPFLSDNISDREDAEDFLLNHAVKEYDSTDIAPLTTVNFLEKQKNKDTLSISLVQQWQRIVDKFRERLSDKCNPFGTNVTGIELHKPSEELQKILYDLKLYQYGKYLDEKIRQYAKYYYNRLVQKSRDNVVDLLVIDDEPTEEKANNKKSGKGKKNKNKKNRRNRKGNAAKSKDKSQASESHKSRSQNAPAEDDEDNYEIDIFQSTQAESENAMKFLNEIDMAIGKKHTNTGSKPSMEESEGAEPIQPTKALEVISSEVKKVEDSPSHETVHPKKTASKAKKEKIAEISVEDYNKNIESLNDRLFVKVDDLVLSNSEENNEDVSESNPLKPEDFEKDAETDEKKLEDLNGSEEFIQEIRSEGGREDTHKLDQSSNASHQYPEEIKGLRNSDKGYKGGKAKHKGNKKQNSAKKKQNKLVKLEEMKTDGNKGTASELNSGLKSSTTHLHKVGEIKINKQLSYTSEVKSTRSEDKSSRNKNKNVHSTNPTSETSSFKDSSVASHQDVKVYHSENKSKKGKSQVVNENWIQTEKKAKKPREFRKKKPLKSDRPKYQNPVPEEEPRRANNKSKSPSDSIWNQESVQAMFSPQEFRKESKKKKLPKKIKTASSVPKPEAEEQATPTHGGKDTTEKQKRRHKEPKEIGIEEKKIDLSVKPSPQPNSFSANKAKFFDDEANEYGKDLAPAPVQQISRKHKSENQNIGFHRNEKFQNEMIEGADIPDETVSSFYQLDEDQSMNGFTKNKSQTYSYNHEMDPYSGHNDYNHSNYQRNMYTDDDHCYNDDADYYPMERPNSMPIPTPNVIETRQFECEKLLYETLSSEIEQVSERIIQQVDMIKDYRYDIKHQLEQITIDMFGKSHYNVQAHIYGSVATGLALPESDMDIVVTGISSFGNHDTHIENLTSLYQRITGSFSSKVLIHHINLPNTQMPIMKLKFDLSEYYDEKMKYDQSALPYINFDSIESINPKLKVLAVDISICDSFEGKEHQGIRAAYFVESKLIEYPILKPVCLVLKKLLVKHKGYNDPYTGGLGSFSLFLMLYAAYFIEKINTFETFHNEETHPARLFTWFLTYFGEYFDMDSMAIMFMQEAMPLVVLKAYCGLTFDLERKTLCVLDPFNSKNNTTQKAFRIEQVCNLFSETKQKIFKEYMNIYNSPSLEGEMNILEKIL